MYSLLIIPTSRYSHNYIISSFTPGTYTYIYIYIYDFEYYQVIFGINLFVQYILCIAYMYCPLGLYATGCNQTKPSRHPLLAPSLQLQVMSWNILADLYATQNVAWLRFFFDGSCLKLLIPPKEPYRIWICWFFGVWFVTQVFMKGI